MKTVVAAIGFIGLAIGLIAFQSCAPNHGSQTVTEKKVLSCESLALCAAPPEGCTYTNPPIDQSGCPVGCGNLKCAGPCPLYPCPAPPIGCGYIPNRLGPGECASSCGTLVCPVQSGNLPKATK